MAEDFYAAFGLGNDDKLISPLDVAGVALIAVQELDAQNQQQDATITALQARQEATIEALQARLAALEATIATLAEQR